MGRMAMGGTVMALLAFATAPWVSAADFDNDWPELVERLERAVPLNDLNALSGVRIGSMALLDTDLTADQGALVRYMVAYSTWRRIRNRAIEEGERDALIEEALDLLTEVTGRNPADAEAHALLGSLYGFQISFAPWKGMFLGRRASGALNRASELAPQNPRVLLLQGVSAIHRPRMFGGGTRKAASLLQEALAAFRTEPNGRPWPRWGHADTRAWLGYVLMQQGDSRAAEDHYLHALELEPNFRWVSEVLLPELHAGDTR